MSGLSVAVGANYPEIVDEAGYTLRPMDYGFLGIDEFAAWSCADRTSPLGIPGNDFALFVSGLREALRRQSLHDADVRLQGSARSFFSSPLKKFPRSKAERAQLFMSEFGRVWREKELSDIEKVIQNQWQDDLPGQRPFDSMFSIGLSPEKSDLDVQISSDLAFKFAREVATDRGVPAEQLRFHNPSYNFLIKEISDTEFLYLNRWAAEWEEALGRGVAIAIFESNGPPRADHGISSHFSDDDWVIVEPRDVSHEG